MDYRADKVDLIDEMDDLVKTAVTRLINHGRGDRSTVKGDG